MNEQYMRPEVRELLDLTLEEKIQKSQEIIREAKKYGKLGLGFSGGTDSLVLLHLALPIHPDITVVFVNTYHQFPETYKFIDSVKRDWNIQDFNEVKAETDKFEEFKESFGFKTPGFTQTCCDYHKILPKNKALEDLNIDAFLTGIRGVEHEERAKESIFSPRQNHTRVHALLFWKQDEILEYVKRTGIRVNPLYVEGYTSLGCLDCTEKNPDPTSHERAGRGVVREKIMKRLRDLGYD